MNRCFNELYSRIVADIDLDPFWQGNLRHAERARVRFRARSDDLEGREHRKANVRRNCSKPKVHVDEGGFMAWKPSGLERDSTAFNGPFGPVSRCRHSAA